MYVADAKGFFRAEGLELELVPLQQQAAWGFSSGKIDFNTGDYIYIMNVMDKGLGTRQIVASLPNLDPRRANDGLFVLEDCPIRGPADLRGKRIAMVNVWFSCAWYVLEYIGRAGLTLDDVDFIVIPTRHQEQVLVSGHVDALFAFSPVDAELRRKGGYRQLFSTADIPGRRIARGATMVRESYARTNPDNLRRCAAAIANAIEWANRNQDEVVRIGIDRGRLDPALAPYVYTRDGKGDYSVVTWPEHGLQEIEDITYWLDLAERHDVVRRGNLKLSNLYTNAFNPFARENGRSE
ncbi:ABC transporter substrate-binding protein [Methylosinus sp. H3A]|uniref:ABC transporter substrate-binding protein n=1 Tax=Methylosinus sp. H3A TaxID=2785786 RepID=UPI0018C31555|nr:ABC transporter substrate-binding protein [Methylosinus sp. H3A]MBG0809984.1 ABC transporter substrate-binding protein [Methylosinus sp. H3A]